MMPRSLEDIAIRKIASDLDCYGDILWHISPPCRRLVFDYTVDAMARGLQYIKTSSCWKILPILLSSKEIKTIDREILRLFYYDRRTRAKRKSFRFEEFIQIVFNGAKSIENLELTKSFAVNFVKIIEPHAVATICSFESLARLEFDTVPIRLTHFKNIAIECRSLRFVRALRVKIDAKLSLLDKCERFVYHSIDSRFLRQKKLEITLGKEIPERLAGTNLRVYRKLGVKNEFLTLSHLKTLSGLTLTTHLEMLCAFNGKVWSHQVPHWPRLESLHFRCEGKPCSNVWKVLLNLLKNHGRHLESLSVADLRPQARWTFEKLFELCPNLHSLRLSSCYLSGKVPIRYLGRLRSFYLFNTGTCKTPTAISSILCAPHLEKLDIILSKVDIRDVQEIQNMLSAPNHGLLRNLTMEKLQLVWLNGTNEDALLFNTLRHIIERAVNARN